MRLSDIPIQRKLPLTIGLGLFLFCGVVLLQTLTLSRTMSGYEHLLDHEMAIRWQSAQMTIQVLQARRDEKDFLARKDPALIQGVAAKIRLAMEAGHEIQQLADHTGPAREVIAQLNVVPHLQQYASLFQSVAQSWQERGLDHVSGAQGRFREAAHDLESLFTDGTELLPELERLLHLTLIRLLDPDPATETQTRALAQRLILLLQSAQSPSAGTLLTILQEHDATLASQALPVATVAEARQHPAYAQLAEVLASWREQMVPGGYIAYLTLRRLEKDYLLRQDDTYLALWERQAQDLAQRLEQAPDAVKNRMIASLSRYRQAMQELAALDDRIQTEMEAMRATIRQTEPMIDQIGSLAQDLAAITAMNTRNFAEENAQLTFMICLVTVLGCGLLSFFIVRGIVDAIAKLWHFSREVANGNLEATITLDNQDEIGHLALVMGEMVNRMRAMRLIADRMVMIMSLAARGAIPEPIDAQLQGDFQKMCTALNEMIHRLRELRLIADHVDSIARGEVPQKLHGSYQGDFKRMADAINSIIDKLNEMGMLTHQDRPLLP